MVYFLETAAVAGAGAVAAGGNGSSRMGSRGRISTLGADAAEAVAGVVEAEVEGGG